MDREKTKKILVMLGLINLLSAMLYIAGRSYLHNAMSSGILPESMDLIQNLNAVCEGCFLVTLVGFIIALIPKDRICMRISNFCLYLFMTTGAILMYALLFYLFVRDLFSMGVITNCIPIVIICLIIRHVIMGVLYFVKKC